MPGLGRKTWSPGDTLTASDVNGYLMDQSVMVFAGTAARSSAIPTPSAGMVAYSTATSLQVYNGSAWVSLSTGYGVASGGTTITPWSVSTINYNGSKFTTDGTLTVSTAGLFDVLLVGPGGAGAGGGGDYAQGCGGGGGGGQVIATTIYLPAAAYAVKIGAGQAGVRNIGDNPISVTSIENAVSVICGGTGAGYFSQPSANGNGGGGGGASGTTGVAGVFTGFSTTFTGGNGRSAANPGGAGGGGAGAGGNGANFSGTTTGGNGGAGYNATNFNGGVSLTIGGGGGGGTITGTAGTGTNGGGNGGVNAVGSNGTANTGGGGGGGASAGATRVGGNGGSGIVFVRWRV